MLEPMCVDASSTNARTLASYQAAPDAYERAEKVANPTDLTSFLKAFAKRLPAGASALEIGSATGRDAAFLELCGVLVHRTDATPAFVAPLRAGPIPPERRRGPTDLD